MNTTALQRRVYDDPSRPPFSHVTSSQSQEAINSARPSKPWQALSFDGRTCEIAAFETWHAIRVQSPAGTLRIFACENRVPDDVVGRRVFSRISRFPLPFHSGAAPYSPQSPSSALETTLFDIVINSRNLCFTAFGVGPLVFVRGSMNTEAYCNILDNEMLPTLWCFYGMEPCYFQDGNSRCHVPRVTMQWYADNNVRRLDWATQSLDLNPIEHLWNKLDRRVRARQARPKSIAQLMEWLQEEWRRIPVDVLQTLVESMRDRVAAVIAARALFARDEGMAELKELARLARELRRPEFDIQLLFKKPLNGIAIVATRRGQSRARSGDCALIAYASVALTAAALLALEACGMELVNCRRPPYPPPPAHWTSVFLRRPCTAPPLHWSECALSTDFTIRTTEQVRRQELTLSSSNDLLIIKSLSGVVGGVNWTSPTKTRSTSGIVQQDSHMRKPGRDPVVDWTRFALVGGEQQVLTLSVTDFRWCGRSLVRSQCELVFQPRRHATGKARRFSWRYVTSSDRHASLIAVAQTHCEEVERNLELV
ncbi:hypothetical protein PR048_033133 [Dryococelus australis]|uniref:Uncharacterized protein n=1 Tax=Dryococelus australis TaxID=614101 RepID=A0ABQ9FZE5_9NEOP|nr:hypothetical protein PR048_033133 [Dryococelus australis]